MTSLGYSWETCRGVACKGNKFCILAGVPLQEEHGVHLEDVSLSAEGERSQQGESQPNPNIPTAPNLRIRRTGCIRHALKRNSQHVCKGKDILLQNRNTCILEELKWLIPTGLKVLFTWGHFLHRQEFKNAFVLSHLAKTNLFRWNRYEQQQGLITT